MSAAPDALTAAPDALTAAPVAGRGARARTTAGEKRQRTPKGAPAAIDIRIGAEPRVDLLPAEIRLSRRHEQIVRRMLVGLVAVVAVTVVAVLGANMLALGASSALTAEQARGVRLQNEQQKFTTLRQTQSELALVKASQAVGGATDIDLEALGTALLSALPAETAITNVTLDAATPLSPFAQSALPGAQAQVATVSLTVSAPDLAAITQWYTTLGTLPNVVGVSAGAVSAQAPAGYQAVAVLHYGISAWDGRFLPATGGK